MIRGAYSPHDTAPPQQSIRHCSDGLCPMTAASFRQALLPVFPALYNSVHTLVAEAFIVSCEQGVRGLRFVFKHSALSGKQTRFYT